MQAYRQENLFRAMASPAFYPHPVDRIETRETHISMVFLTGDWAYKVKKAVDFGFLDFSTAEKRRRFCHRECELNRRLTTDVYQGVTPLTRTRGGFHLNGPGPVVEYAVRMRQLPETQSLQHRLQTTEISPDFLLQLVSLLTTFYTRQGACDLHQAGTAFKNLRSACENNFHQSLPFVGPYLDKHLFAIVRSATRSFLNRGHRLFEHRAEDGWIRDGHGDLRTCHIYSLPQTGIQVIDCIEFDDRLRQIDVISDLAFLSMDFDFEGRPHLGSQLMDIYSRLSPDPSAFLILPLYKCYRAMVRCKVSCLHLQTAAAARHLPGEIEAAQRYLKLAYRYAVSFSRPKIWAFSGLPASGKSTVARAMARTIKAPHLRSDAIRHKLFGSHSSSGHPPAFNTGIYAQVHKRRTYGKLLGQTQAAIDRGRSVIVDATFSRPEYRRELKRLARDRHIRLTFVECRAPLAVIKSRLRLREQHPSLSQARLQDFKSFQRCFVPLGGAGMTAHIVVNTTCSPDECVRRILAEDHRVATACMVSSLKVDEFSKSRLSGGFAKCPSSRRATSAA
jgi:aminoglycoside phosphotransferase family enzyme/predicted kinase